MADQREHPATASSNPATDVHLAIDGLTASYGEATVLRDVSLEIRRGEVVTLVGRNGAGKTTLIRCVMGLHRQLRGRIAVSGTDVTGLVAHQRARLGLGYVPDDRGTYASLSVEEHLTLPRRAARGGSQPWPLERIYTAFPVLEKRRGSRGTQLSGGEQQMLALARVLAMGADLLLCDEPTEGLSPVLVAQIGDILREIKAQGVTVLLIEQNVHFASTVADRHYLLAQGAIVDALDNAAVRQRRGELLEYLGM